VPEPKTVKNRVHLDLNPGGGSGTAEERRSRVAQKVASLVDAGATVLHEMDARTGDHWVVMQDPERNEFCVQ
jgi:hypothetical protein